MSELSGASKRTVDAHLDLLTSAALVTPIRGGGRSHTNTYIINFFCDYCTKPGSNLCKSCIVKGATTAPFNKTKGATTAPFEAVKGATIAIKGATTAPEQGVNKVKPSRQKKYSDDDLRIAEIILQGVRKLSPNHKQPNMEAWADAVRLMRERDKRQPDQIEAVFHWANADDFWQSNILSPAKLRKQFDQLLVKMTGASRTRIRRVAI